MKRRLPLPKHFNWRALLLRFVVNAVALAVTAIVVPQIYFMGDYRILTWLVISAAFGLLNTFVKPVVQFLMLPFLFVSYGLVVVVINSLMLFILSVIFTRRFHVTSLLMAFIGGLVFGLVGSMLENLLGLVPPITDGDISGLRGKIGASGAPPLESRLVQVSEKALGGQVALDDSLPPPPPPPTPPPPPPPLPSTSDEDPLEGGES